MYEDFHVTDRWTNQKLHCLYQALIVAIATRHADAVDVKFLAGTRPVWIALPLTMWVQYEQETGRIRAEATGQAPALSSAALPGRSARSSGDQVKDAAHPGQRLGMSRTGGIDCPACSAPGATAISDSHRPSSGDHRGV